VPCWLLFPGRDGSKRVVITSIMKRVILGSAVLALLAIPVGTSADMPPTKVDVCHMNSAKESIVFPGFSFTFGRIISVNENAVRGHRAHGDADIFEDLTPTARAGFVSSGIRLPNANCVGFVF